MKLNLKEVPELKPNPIFKGLSDDLKDPKNFKKVEKKLDVLKSNHKHKTIKSYAGCIECKNKFEERKRIMQEIGFNSIGQYVEWKKIMRIIIKEKDFQLK